MLVSNRKGALKYIRLVRQAHLDVTAGANIGAYMTTHTFVVVGVNIAPHGTFVFLDPENGVFRTVDYTVVTLEAHPAAHAPTRFFNRLFFFQHREPLLEVA